jgi:4-amino-4-deoxy-L-arabinose transferase-like glycosyltransferase
VKATLEEVDKPCMEKDFPASPVPIQTGLGWRRVAVLLIFSGSLLGWRLGSARTITYHEATVVQGAVEMLQSGNWLVPTLGDEPWLEKPPLAHWIIAALGAVCGDINPWLARLPSCLCGIIGMLLLAALASRKRGPNFGLLVGLVLSTTVWFATYARLAEADIYLWLICTACLCLFARRFAEPVEQPRWHNGPIVFFLLLGLANLAKGLLFGPVLVLGICGSFVLLRRRWDGWRFLTHPAGWLVFFAVGSAWPLYILCTYPETTSLWLLHTVGRMNHGMVSPKPFWYYATTIPWQVLPWTLVMLPVLWNSFRRAWKEPGSLDRLLWLWLLVPTVLLSCSSGKHHHYVIYALSPCAFWAVDGLMWWASWLGRFQHAKTRWWPAALALAIPISAWFVLKPRLGSAIAREATLGIAGIVIGLMLMTHTAVRGRLRAAAVVLFALVWAIFSYVHGVWLQRTDTYNQETALLVRVRQTIQPGVEIYCYRDLVSRSRYYTRYPIHHCWSIRDLPVVQDHPVYVLSALEWDAELRKAGYLPCLTPPLPKESYAHYKRVWGLYCPSQFVGSPLPGPGT